MAIDLAIRKMKELRMNTVAMDMLNEKRGNILLIESKLESLQESLKRADLRNRNCSVSFWIVEVFPMAREIEDVIDSTLRSAAAKTTSSSSPPTGGGATPPLVMSIAALSKSRSVFSLLFRHTPHHHSSTSTSPAPSSPSISALAADLLSLPSPPPDDLSPLLLSHSFPSLLRSSSSDPAASLHLLSLLKPRPELALEVFNWRRKIATGPDPIPLTSEEYAKAISLAGRARDVELAAALFSEAITSFPEPALYNALMFTYMYNGLTRRCVAVFESLRQDRRLEPSIVSYNILLSLFGRSMLIDHMEAVLRAADEGGFERTLETHNTVIAAYVTAWMWDRMEAAYISMKSGPVKPDISTHLLVLRGYAHSGNLPKMEKTYKLILSKVPKVDETLIRAMICAYCKSKHPNRIKRIEELLELINGAEYKRWLNVLLIQAYAQENKVEIMERFIEEAFNKKTIVTASGVMRAIISSYFRSDLLDQLTRFVKRAEEAGWRLCRTLYHCKMVMYGKHNRVDEMRGVLDDMASFRFDRNKKTFWIIYKACLSSGRKSEADSVVGLLWKSGYENPVGKSSVFPCG
ncbi:hypothetical protein LUZ60_003936 [Juncus effusus]|nr:hypothetical protein LUZ60_003936 [Juncus effusus]